MLAVLVHLSQYVTHCWLEDSTENNSTSPYLPYLESGKMFSVDPTEHKTGSCTFSIIQAMSFMPSACMSALGKRSGWPVPYRPQSAGQIWCIQHRNPPNALTPKALRTSQRNEKILIKVKGESRKRRNKGSTTWASNPYCRCQGSDSPSLDIPSLQLSLLAIHSK